MEKPLPIPPAERTWQRRQYILNPKFQFTLIGYVAVLTALVIGILYGADAYFFHKFEAAGKELGIPAEHVYFQFLAEQKTLMAQVFLVTSLLVTGLLLVGGVIISHRIAGPIYRACKHMVECSEGKDVGDLRFRRKDFFPELADSINRGLRRFRPGAGKDDKHGRGRAA